MKLATLTIIAFWGLTFGAGAESVAADNERPCLAYEVPGTPHRDPEPTTSPEDEEPPTFRWDDTADTSDELFFHLYDPEVKIPTHQETDLNNGVHDPLLEGYPADGDDGLREQREQSPLLMPVPNEDPVP